MDPTLFWAILRNEKNTFIDLVQKNEEFLEQRTAKSQDTVLHLASRLGHIELVMEILMLRPMVAAENIKLETPIHEASRKGHTKILLLLLETNPWAAYKLNSENQSAFFMACSNGHLEVVKLLLNQPWLVGSEDEGFDEACLHVSVSRGHTDIVKELINVCPYLVQKSDMNGYYPMHYACSSGHQEITKMLLRLDVDLALQFNNIGYMPLHLAAMNGKTAIFEEFMQIAPTSFHHLTRQGETILHLTAKYKQYDAFIWLVREFHDNDLFHRPDQFGNTLLHLAISRGCSQMVEYLINKTAMDINSQNCEGLTALDILDKDGNVDEFLHLKPMLETAGGKRSTSLHVKATGLLNISVDSLPESHLDNVPRLPITNEIGDPYNRGTNSKVEPLEHHVEETEDIQDDNTPENTTRSPTNLRRHKRLSNRRQEELAKLYNDRRNKRRDIYMEALQNARNTITLVAILIATVTFTAGINPPGDVKQDVELKHHRDGELRGQAIAVKTTAFKVFTICNNVALFTSLCIVLVLVSIIPFQRKQLMRLLVITHKVMWVAVSFMATAYVAATWIIIPAKHHSTRWMLEALLAVSVGTMGTVVVYLGIMFVDHWLRKLQWRKENGRKQRTVAPTEGKIQSTFAKSDVKVDIQLHSTNYDLKDETGSEVTSSSNSDISSSMSRRRGYHPF